jgi:serine protease Do
MFDYQRKSEPRFRFFIFYLAILMLAFSPGSVNFYAQTSGEALRNAAITPEKLSASFAEVVKAVEPAVVSIDIKGIGPDLSIRGGNGSNKNGNGNDLVNLLRRPPRPSSAVGSGFIVDKTGYILTNYHVVKDSSRITIKIQSGEEFLAKLIGTDEETDLAVLKIETGRDSPFVRLGDSDAARVGDWVLAIGSPFGLARTVTAGIVSQVKREEPYSFRFPKTFIQTDAAINSGNSGGPLVNMVGEVIGVNSQSMTSTGDDSGIGFALQINEAMNVYRQIVQNGKVRRGYLGVSLDSVKAEFAKVYGFTEAKGAIILSLSDKKSAAASAGLQPGDVILEYNNQKVENAMDLFGKISATAPEQTVNIVFMRETGARLERKTTTVTLSERPSNNKAVNDDPRRPLTVEEQKEDIKPFGLTLSELTPSLVAAYKLANQKGLLVKEINPASFVAGVKASNGNYALNEGDLIQRINRTEVANLKTFGEIAGKLKRGDAVVLQVLTNNRSGRGLQLKIVQFTNQ